ncbi:hypothetical protein C7S13_1028 [Burkholderia cepacia]|nr:hypothetical protein [Burkholderia cepacia]
MAAVNAWPCCSQHAGEYRHPTIESFPDRSAESPPFGRANAR